MLDNVPVSHNMAEFDGKLISREDHANEFDVVSIERRVNIRTAYHNKETLRNHAIRMTSSYNVFNITAGRST